MQITEEVDQPIKLEYLSGHKEKLGTNLMNGSAIFDDVRVNSNASIPRTPASLPMKPQSDTSGNIENVISNVVEMIDNQSTKQQQQSCFANALPALAMQHAAKLVASNNSTNNSTNSRDGMKEQFAGQMHSVPSVSPQMQYTYPNSNASMTASPIVSTSSASNIASAVKLASMGVGFGPGINPHISNPTNGMQNTNQSQINPPIVNTGNNGPMCVQPGDWVCSKCCFVNWRRRRVCMRCYPLADQSNEVSRSIANGAAIAAQIAAGMQPSAELVASLTTGKRPPQTVNSGNGTLPTTTLTPSTTNLYTPASSNPVTAIPLLPSRSQSINNFTPFKPSSSPPKMTEMGNEGLRTTDFVDSTLSYSLQNAFVSESQWNNRQSLSPFQSFTSNSGQYTTNGSYFTSNSVQASPLQSPMMGKKYDVSQSISNRPDLIRHAHSSSILSSLNPYSNSYFPDQNAKQQPTAKSGGATPVEENQIDLQGIWFGSSKNVLSKDKLSIEPIDDSQISKVTEKSKYNGIGSYSQSIFDLPSKRVAKDEKKLNEEDNEMNGSDCNPIHGNDYKNTITFSAANETDEIVVQCGNEKRFSFTNGMKSSSSSVLKIENCLLPIEKAAIEPPISISNSFQQKTSPNQEQDQQNRPSTPTNSFRKE